MPNMVLETIIFHKIEATTTEREGPRMKSTFNSLLRSYFKIVHFRDFEGNRAGLQLVGPDQTRLDSY